MSQALHHNRPLLEPVRLRQFSRRVLCALLVAALPAPAEVPDDDRDLWRIERERALGPVILEARYGDVRYTVHFPGAVADEEAGPGFRCPERSVFEPLSDSDYRLAVGRIAGEMSEIERQHQLNLGKALEYYQSQAFPEYQRRFDEGRISKAEQRALVQHGEAEWEAIRKLPLHEQDQRRMQALEEERYRVERSLVFYVQHHHSNDAATIVPMRESRPDPAFAAELAQQLTPFFRSCGAVRTFSTQHFFAGLYRASRINDREPAVLGLRFRVADGVATYEPRERGALGYSAHDPAQNPELTLGGFKLAQEARLKQRQAEVKRRIQLAADYRRAFATAEGRRAGIVYRLDPYWSQYDIDVFDPVRRVFDGDFAFVDDQLFRVYFHLFADIYSNRCRDLAPSLNTYKVPYTEYGGTTWHPDGSRTITQIQGEALVPIDTRFTPQWADWRGETNLYMLYGALRETATGTFDPLGYTVQDAAKAISDGAKALFPEGYYMGRFMLRHPCGSATIEQLRANFVRAANGLPSVQEAGALIAGADAESDPLADASRSLAQRPDAQPLPPPKVVAVPATLRAATTEPGTRAKPAAVPDRSSNVPAMSRVPGAAPAQAPGAAVPAPVPASESNRPTLDQALEAVRADVRAQEAEAEARYMRDLAAVRDPDRRMQIMQQFAMAQANRKRELDRRLAKVRAEYRKQR